MLSDEKLSTRNRVISCGVSEEKDFSRIPPAAEKLFESDAWMSIMVDIALTAAVAEMKVRLREIYIKDSSSNA